MSILLHLRARWALKARAHPSASAPLSLCSVISYSGSPSLSSLSSSSSLAICKCLNLPLFASVAAVERVTDLFQVVLQERSFSTVQIIKLAAHFFLTNTET